MLSLCCTGIWKQLETESKTSSEGRNKTCGTIAPTQSTRQYYRKVKRGTFTMIKAKLKSNFGSAPDWTDSIFHTNGLKEGCPFLLIYNISQL